MKQSCFWKDNCLISVDISVLYGTFNKCSLVCSEQHRPGPGPDPAEFTPHTHTHTHTHTLFLIHYNKIFVVTHITYSYTFHVVSFFPLFDQNLVRILISSYGFAAPCPYCQLLFDRHTDIWIQK